MEAKMVSSVGSEVQLVTISAEHFHALMRAVGSQIDPETAEVFWRYAQVLDPYGVYPELPEDHQLVGREYFARAPGSDVWVDFGDLPTATRDALWEKHSSKLAFPAGLDLSGLVDK
jgi:hypothetical protein